MLLKTQIKGVRNNFETSTRYSDKRLFKFGKTNFKGKHFKKLKLFKKKTLVA